MFFCTLIALGCLVFAEGPHHELAYVAGGTCSQMRVPKGDFEALQIEGNHRKPTQAYMGVQWCAFS